MREQPNLKYVVQIISIPVSQVAVRISPVEQGQLAEGTIRSVNVRVDISGIVKEMCRQQVALSMRRMHVSAVRHIINIAVRLVQVPILPVRLEKLVTASMRNVVVQADISGTMEHASHVVQNVRWEVSYIRIRLATAV